MSDLVFFLPSSDGWSSLSLHIENRFNGEGDKDTCRMRIVVQSKAWPIDEELGAESELRQDYRIELSQVLVAVSSLGHLERELGAYCEVPKMVEVELAGSFGQSLVLGLGDTTGYICGPGETVLSVSYQGTRMPIGEWRFVTDRTCLDSFLERLRVFLAETVDQSTPPSTR